MSQPHPFQPQRHPSGRGYEVIDHRDMSLHGHWSDESTAAILATTWNLELATQQRDEALAALRDCRDRLRLLIDKGRYTLLDAVAEQKAAELLARAGGAA